jgi:hypothetical protein
MSAPLKSGGESKSRGEDAGGCVRVAAHVLELEVSHRYAVEQDG